METCFCLEKSLRARDLPYELLRYEDSEQAIRAISGDRDLMPDLILVDLNLPRREGFRLRVTIGAVNHAMSHDLDAPRACNSLMSQNLSGRPHRRGPLPEDPPQQSSCDRPTG